MIEKRRRNEQQELQSEQPSEFAADVQVGLSSMKKYLASKYFYDEPGSKLFEQICLQPEYYPTRTEAGILREYSQDIVSAAVTGTRGIKGSECASGISVVELGSGSSTKTRILLEQLLSLFETVHYFPIDISQRMLQETSRRLRTEFPRVNTVGIPLEYSSGLEQVNKRITEDKQAIPERKLILFLGSSIGNFEQKQSISFLRMLRQKMSLDDYLLVGFDLQKEKSVINAAYNDSKGVTAKFNLNLLERINRELDGHFALEKFAHRAFYNEQLNRVEMHLVSLVDQDVRVGLLARSFGFKKNETIHTENSYKYSSRQIVQIASQSGLAVDATFMDENKWFALSLLRPAE